MIKLIEILRHLTPEEKQELEKVEEQIYQLQGRLQTYEDTLELAELYKERNRIIRGEREAETNGKIKD